MVRRRGNRVYWDDRRRHNIRLNATTANELAKIRCIAVQVRSAAENSTAELRCNADVWLSHLVVVRWPPSKFRSTVHSSECTGSAGDSPSSACLSEPSIP